MVWIKNGSVSGGNPIDMMGVTTEVSAENYLTQNFIPGKDVSLSYGSRIFEVDFLGINNAKYTITGRFDTSRTQNTAGSTCVSIPILGSIMRQGNPSWFYDEKNILNPAGSTAVLPDQIKITRNMTGSPSWVRYNLSLKETAEW